MKISLLKPNSLSPKSGIYNEYVQECGKERTGTILQQVELKEIIKACNQIPKAESKHQNGSIFPYINNTLGKSTWEIKEGKNDGVIFIDIDHITKEAAETIFNEFEKICCYFSCLYGIQYSSSYYLKDYAGLHVYVASPILNEDEYNEYATLSLALFSYAVLKITGIDFRIPMIGDEQILDEHNTKITQRFFLYYSDYKLNEDCNIFTNDLFKKEDIERLKKEYKELHFTHVRRRKYDRFDLIDGDSCNIEKVSIDRNFSIGKYTGNDVRWRISKIAQIIFKDNAKVWCDKYFYCENNKSIYTKQTNEEYPSLIIKQWLEDNGYLRTNNVNLIKYGEYIIKYKDDIINFINKNKRAEIIAPTGVGKTTFINGNKNNRYDLFNQNPDSCFSLAKELNAIVIVPFNVTNKLYDNMVEVSSENCNDVPQDEPCVMIWDQAIKHWSKIKDRTLIIDEAHCLFLDRRYRNTAIKLMNYIKEDDCKIVLFTATPSGEGEELDCKYLKYNNERNVIKTDVIQVNNVDIAQYKFIVNCLRNNWYDKIVLFDDFTAQRIYERIYCDGEFIDEVAYIRADTKNSDDFINLRNNEILEKKLTICTCVAFNGLNFKNTNERILVITSFANGQTTANEIIQESGRIRNSEVYLKIYWSDIHNEDNLEYSINKAVILNTAEQTLNIPEGLLQYNHKLTEIETQEALRSIQQYINDKSDISIVTEDLLKTGYYIIKELNFAKDEIMNGSRLKLALKRKESDEFINDLMNDSMISTQYPIDNINNYKSDWKSQIKNIIDNDTYTGITLDTFKKFYKSTNKNTLISTIIQKVKKIIRISLLEDNLWNNYEKNIDTIRILLKNDANMIKELNTNYKENKKIRDKYKGKIIIRENKLIDLSDVFEDYISSLYQDYIKEKELKSLAGQISGKKTKKITVTDKFKHMDKYNLRIGQIFDSCSELAVYTNTTKKTVSSWINKNWIIQEDKKG